MKIPKKTIECNIESLEGYNFPIDEPFNLLIVINDVKYEFIINIKEDSDKVIIVGSNPSEDIPYNKPYYKELNGYVAETIIYYNDPTRYLDKNLINGYGIGTSDDWYLKNIADIIKKIANNIFTYGQLNQFNNLFFYGEEDAGFTSIVLSTLIKNSVSIVKRPTIQPDIIDNFSFLKTLFGNMSQEDIQKTCAKRFNLINLFQEEEYLPISLIILDYEMNTNLKKDYILFFKQLLNLPKIPTETKNKIRIQLEQYKSLKAHHLQSIIFNIDTIIHDNKDPFNFETIHKNKIKEYENELKNQIEQVAINNEQIDFYEAQLNERLNKIDYNNEKIRAHDSKISELNEHLKANAIEIEKYKTNLDKLQEEILENNKKILEYKDKQKSLVINLKNDYKNEIENLKSKHEKSIQTLKTNHNNNIQTLKTSYNNDIQLKNNQLKYNKATISYYKSRSIINKIFSGLPYIYILLKSKQNILLNIKLYRALLNNEWFNIGYYLSNYSDVNTSKWCTYLTPQTHYVCFGFDEKRLPHKNYENNLSKKEIIKKLII